MSTNIREIVEAQVQDKIAKGEALEARVQAVNDAAEALEIATRDAASARREALNAGWTEAELKRLGLAAPRAARTRKPRASTPEPAAAAAPAYEG